MAIAAAATTRETMERGSDIYVRYIREGFATRGSRKAGFN